MKISRLRHTISNLPADVLFPAFSAQKYCHSADLYHTELLNQVYHADGNL